MELAGIDVASMTRLLSQSANYKALAETVALVRNIDMSKVFGSAARGDDREDSDVDFLVDFAPGTSIIDIIGIQRELRELLGVPVELVPRNGLKERVRKRAAKDLVPL